MYIQIHFEMKQKIANVHGFMHTSLNNSKLHSTYTYNQHTAIFSRVVCISRISFFCPCIDIIFISFWSWD